MSYLLHPLGYCAGTPTQVTDCKGYNAWSGIGSDITEITLVTAVVGTIVNWYIHSRCHIGGIGLKGCRKRGHYPFKHYKLCRKHHPDVPNKLTHLHIIKLHKETK